LRYYSEKALPPGARGSRLIRRIAVQSQPGKIVHKTLFQKYPTHKKRVVGCKSTRLASVRHPSSSSSTAKKRKRKSTILVA
jgi:hypothetical protein